MFLGYFFHLSDQRLIPASTARSQNSVGAKIGAPWTMRRNRFSPLLCQSANDPVFAQLDASDAIIFGTPTYMGGPSAQFKAFADACGGKWYAGAWRDKLAAGFTISSGPSGDKLSTLHYLFTLAMQRMWKSG